MRCNVCLRALAATPILCVAMSAGIVNVTIDSSAVAGSSLGVAIDFTTSEPGTFNSCFPTCVEIHDFSAPGSTMGLPLTTNGFTQGDLILIQNPAEHSELEKGSPFNEVIVVLNPLGNLITFRLEYSDNPPADPANPPDQISVFLLDTTDFLPVFPTSDPTGANALFAIDLNGTPGGDISVFSPTTRADNNLRVVIPRDGIIPEPGSVVLTAAGLALLVSISQRAKERKRRTTE